MRALSAEERDRLRHAAFSHDEHLIEAAQRIVDVREAEAVARFVGRQSVAYRCHSAQAITEDMALAVREFGVPIEAFYPDPVDQTSLRAALATSETERGAGHEGGGGGS